MASRIADAHPFSQRLHNASIQSCGEHTPGMNDSSNVTRCSMSRSNPLLFSLFIREFKFEGTCFAMKNSQKLDKRYCFYISKITPVRARLLLDSCNMYVLHYVNSHT